MSNSESLDVAARFTAAIASLQTEPFLNLYTDDVKVWHNVSDEPQTKLENIGLLGSIFGIVGELYYDDIVCQPTPTGFVQYHVVKGRFRDGAPMPALNSCVVATVADGKIAEMKEWFDASQWQKVWDRLGLNSSPPVTDHAAPAANADA